MSAGVLALLTLGWSGPADAYPVAFPSRGALPDGVYFHASGHTGEDYGNGEWAIDFTARSYKDSKWQANKDGISHANAVNTDSHIFGVPLFAPEDGEIIACWRSAPDKLTPNTPYDFNGDGVTDAAPMRGGNHLQIRNADGDYVLFLGHLEKNSIPPELCPLPANSDANGDGWPDDNDKDCSLGSWTGYRNGTILPTPVPVRAGDLLGRVGHSGASALPHLHMHVRPFATDALGQPCEGPPEEIEFMEAWAQTCEPGENVNVDDWDSLWAQNPLEPGTPGPNGGIPGPASCFMPDGIGAQQDDNDYGVTATNLHPSTHNDGDLLVYQSGGALRLRSYKLEPNGTITNQSTVNEGAVLDVAVTRPHSARDVVVSVRGSNGVLKHIPYTVSPTNGAIARQYGKELTESAVFQVESTRSPAHDGYVVALEDGAGNLKVIDYHVDAALNITRDLSSSGTGGAIDDVAITSVSVYTAFDGVVTAEITSGGKLTLRSFEVPAAGGVTWADTFATGIEADSVKVDTVPVMWGIKSYVVTSVQLSTGQTLRLDTWEVDTNGQISWVDWASAGAVSAHDATATVDGGDLVSAMSDDDGNFRMIGWRIDTFGGITRNATRSHTAVTETSIIASLGSGRNHLVAARTDAQGELHLFSYGSGFVPHF